MSDTVTEVLSAEPDESVLTNALRNQDDIPILMDVVGAVDESGTDSQNSAEEALFSSEAADAQTVSPETSVVSGTTASAEIKEKAVIQPLSQEAHFSQSMKPSEEIEKQTRAEKESADRQRLEMAIQVVLERKLPEIITDVLTEYAKRES